MGCKNGIESIEVLASNGQPSILYKNLEKELGKEEALKAYLKVHTPEFKAWFGDWQNNPNGASKVVDSNGEPLVVWHGTGTEFDEFDKELRGSTTGKSIDGSFDAENAFFFTDNQNVAFNYAIMDRQNELSNIINGLEKITGFLGNSIDRQKAYKDLRDDSPKFAKYVDGLKEKGLTTPEIMEKLTQMREKYRPLSELTKGGAISNSRRFYKDLQNNVDELKANREAVHAGTYSIINKNGNGINAAVNYDNLILDPDGMLYAHGDFFKRLHKYNGKNIKDFPIGLLDAVIEDIEKAIADGNNREKEDLDKGGFTPKLMPVFLNVRTPVRKDFKGEPFVDQMDRAGAKTEASELVLKAAKSGQDGAIFENIADPEVANNYAVFESNQIKSILNEGSFSKESNKIYYQLTDQEKDYYNGQRMNDRQKTVVQDLINHQENIKLPKEDSPFYININTGKTYERVSNFLFGTQERGKVDPIHAKQGTSFHTILEGVVKGQDFPSIILNLDTVDGTPAGDLVIPTGIGMKFYDFASNFIKNKRAEGVVFMSETILHNEDAGLAGSVDLIGINPDGTISMWDLKTSIHSTLNDSYTNYEWLVKGEGGYYSGQKMSTKDKHVAQQTVYARILEALGHTISDMHILPYTLVKDSNMEILSGAVERVIDLRYDDELAKKVAPIVGDKKVKVIKSSKITFTSDLLDSVNIFLEKRLHRARKNMSNEKDRAKAEQRIKQIISEISKVDDAKKVAAFIEIAHNELASDKGHAVAFDKKVLEVNKGVEEGTISIEKALKTLDDYRVYAEGYSILDEIFDANDEVDWKTFSDDSVMGLLRDSIDAKNRILAKYNSTVDKFMGEWLAEEASENINKEANAKIKKLNISIAAATKHHGADSSRVRELESLKRKYEDSIANSDTLTAGLRTIREDVGLGDYWLSPLISSGNAVLSLFAKKVKKTLEIVRDHIRRFQFKANEEYKAYEKSKGYNSNVAKFNEGLYEKRRSLKIIDKGDGTKEEVWTEQAAFIERTDWTKYNEAVAAMFRSSQGMEPKERRKFIREWFDNNRDVLSREEIENKIAEEKKSTDTDGFNSWIIDNMYNKEMYSLYMTELKSMTPEIASQRYVNNLLAAHSNDPKIITYRKQFTTPKISLYYNQAFAPFEPHAPDSPIKRYYNFLTSTYLAAQERLPKYSRKGMILPSVPKSNTDRFLEQGVEGAKAIAYEAVNYSAEDDATMKYRDLSNEGRFVPIKYTNNMNFDDVSLNLVASIALFEEASLKYKEVSAIIPQVNAMKALVSKAKVLETNSKGKNLVDATATKLGIDKKYLTKHDGNLAAAHLESFIDMQIYGALSEKEIIGGLDAGKITDTMIGFTAHTTMAWDVLKPVANALQANVVLATEGFAREHVSAKNLLKAKGKYLMSQGELMSDATKPFNQSLTGQMIDLYDAIQGQFSDEYGKTLGWSAAKRAVQSKTGFFMMNMGEHEVQTTLMFAMMEDVKLMHEGKEITLNDAYEIGEDGIIKLKEGVTKPDGSAWTEQDRFNFMNKLHAINKRLHGIYNSFDRVHLKRYAAGRLMMIFRNFLVPALKRRYKSLTGDQELGAHTEGFYRTFWNAYGKDLLMLRWNTLTKWSDMNDMEKANVRRFISEMAFIVGLAATTSVLAAAAEGTGDDDLEGYLLHYALYQVTRVRSETFAYLNPKDMLRTMRSPSATTTSIERLVKVLYYIGIDPLDGELDRYKNTTGGHAKGDLKLQVAFKKLFGITGYNLNPEEAVKILNFTR